MTDPISFGAVGAPYWFDQPTAVVGAGASLKGFDLTRLRGLCHVIAVNGSMYDLPFADAWLTIDFDFIRHNAAFLSEPGPPLFIAAPHSKAVGERFAPKIERATYLKYEMIGGRLSENPHVLSCGGTSGFAALNFAFLKRTKLIALFGFDYANVGHYCDRYTWPVNTSDWVTWGQMFDPLPKQLNGIRVINASLTSAVKPFPKMSHDDAVKALVTGTQ